MIPWHTARDWRSPFVLLVVFLCLTGCGFAEVSPTFTPVPTRTPAPTATTAPSATPTPKPTLIIPIRTPTPRDSPTPTPWTAPADAGTWPIYKMDDVNLAFRYPPDWIMREYPLDEEDSREPSSVLRTVNFIPPRYAGDIPPQAPAVSVALYSAPVEDDLRSWLEMRSTNAPFGSTVADGILFYDVSRVRTSSADEFFALHFTHDAMSITIHTWLIRAGSHVVGISYTGHGVDDLDGAARLVRNSLNFIVPPTPTQTLTPSPTPAPTWTAVRDTTRETCGIRSWSEDNLPNLDALRWESLPIQDSHVRYLSSFEYRPVPLNAGPDGNEIAVMLKSRTGEAGLTMINADGDAHWWWDRDTYYAENTGFFHWLPDGRLLRVQNGDIRIGTHDNWQTIQAPAPMSYVRYTSTGIAFARARESETWWRLNIASETWEQVPNALPSFRISIAQDGSRVASYDQIDRLWHAPVALGASAQTVTVEPFEELGSGRTPLPSTHLANSPYWWIDESILRTPVILLGGRYGVTRGNMIVHEDTGAVIRLDYLPVPAHYNHDAVYTVPSDGEWLAVDLWDISEPAPNRRIEAYGLYVAPSHDVTAGTVITGVQSTGWVTEPDAIVVQRRPTNTLAVVQLPATGETATVPLEGAGELLTTSPDGIVALEAGTSTRLLLFTVDGQVTATLDLSDHYDFVERAFAVGNRVYLTAGITGPNDCTYGLVEWTLAQR